MKEGLIALAVLTATATAFGQGAVVFNNRVPPGIDARVTGPDGGGITGPEWRAQLFVWRGGGLWAPLTPMTTFRSSIAAGYVNPVDVIVPGLIPREKATLVMRVFNDDSYFSALTRFQSSPVTITLGGGILPPANLDGLQPFGIPEPQPALLLAVGAFLLLVVLGSRRARLLRQKEG